jgi:hypothetical protein
MRINMARRSAVSKTLAVVVSILTIFVTIPFSVAETVAASPLGVVVTQGTVTVGNSIAPTGTTLFAGDRVAATNQPALISFNSGGRIEMTKAVATLSREGDTLVVHPVEGLLRFNFVKGEEVRINAGRYNFTAVGRDSAHTGELGLNRNGQVVLAMNEGAFNSLDTVSGANTEVSPGNPLEVTDLEGKGILKKSGNTLTDSSKAFFTDALNQKCIVSEKEAYRIASNNANVIKIKGSWKANSGSHAYKIADCTRDALINAGASPEAADAAVASVGAAAGSGAGGLSTAAVIGIGGGAAAALGIGIAVTRPEKSPSSR